MVSNPQSFLAEAQFQRVCAVCGDGGPFHSHHVVSKQALKARGLVDALYDPRNALRLCAGLDGNQCHMRFENRQLQIPTLSLTFDNICFMWDVLGVAGVNYLDRYYTGADRRFTIHEDKGCLLCQRPR
jgi:hypothetical protein